MTDSHRDVVEFLEARSGLEVISIRSSGQSSADQTLIAETPQGRLFLKLGSGAAGERIAAEKQGLDLLGAATRSLTVPGVVVFGQVPSGDGRGATLLATEFLERVSPDASFEAVLAEGLAEMHSWVSETGRYGFFEDNYIGLGRQHGGWSPNWSHFFGEMRLDMMVSVARDKARWRAAWDTAYARLRSRLDEILPSDPGVSLVHGDLWSGNVIPLADAAALIDPAVYFGHREVDIAMTELFGGFGTGFYKRYSEVLPIAQGYPERRAVYNLYHLINHLNIFGDGYAAQVESVLNRFR